MRTDLNAAAAPKQNAVAEQEPSSATQTASSNNLNARRRRELSELRSFTKSQAKANANATMDSDYALDGCLLYCLLDADDLSWTTVYCMIDKKSLLISTNRSDEPFAVLELQDCAVISPQTTKQITSRRLGFGLSTRTEILLFISETSSGLTKWLMELSSRLAVMIEIEVDLVEMGFDDVKDALLTAHQQQLQLEWDEDDAKHSDFDDASLDEQST